MDYRRFPRVDVNTDGVIEAMENRGIVIRLICPQPEKGVSYDGNNILKDLQKKGLRYSKLLYYYKSSSYFVYSIV